MKIRIYLSVLSILLVTSVYGKENNILKVDQKQVIQWNDFVSQLKKLHNYQLYNRQVSIERKQGGYRAYPGFYIEERFIDKDSGLLLSRIQWEREKPDNIHLIEVFIYDNNQQVKYDFLAVYLPEYRNAPIQTLINFHFKDNELSAFRQFDASGFRIYEQCSGKYFNKELLVSLEEHEIPANAGVLPADVSDDLYLACFNHLPATAGKYLNPGHLMASNMAGRKMDFQTYEELDRKINFYSKKIAEAPNTTMNYIERGKLYFQMHDFQKAIDDLSVAISIDKSQDEAWFWRGMSYGRNGQVSEGINDLSVFLKYNPSSSRGYTKRGVRYIWKGDLIRAEQDLKRAIKLDKNNAEAHDDLGVIYAQRGDLKQAFKHFTQTISIDPDYQKGWHNLAMVEYIAENHESALKNVNQALRLSPKSKNSLMLKGEILIALGEKKRGKQLIDEADFLPEGNWSERWPVK